MATPSISAILPFSDRESIRRNWDRLLLCLRSLDYFWTDSVPLDVSIVTPDDEFETTKAKFKRSSKPHRLKIRTFSESDISPILANAPPGYGIAKQMMIKLSAERAVRSDFFLTLDSDLVACKHMNRGSFFVGVRAVTEYFPYGEHPWYRNSAKLLGYEPSSYTLDRPRLFVTPAILSAAILRDLKTDLSARDVPARGKLFGILREKKSWMRFLLQNFNAVDNQYWTEYTLYDLFAERSGKFDKYHQSEVGSDRLHCMQQSLWGLDHFAAWDPRKAFSGASRGYFMVLQSILAHDLDFDDVAARVLAAASVTHPDFAAFHAESLALPNG